MAAAANGLQSLVAGGACRCVGRRVGGRGGGRQAGRWVGGPSSLHAACVQAGGQPRAARTMRVRDEAGQHHNVGTHVLRGGWMKLWRERAVQGVHSLWSIAAPRCRLPALLQVRIAGCPARAPAGPPPPRAPPPPGARPPSASQRPHCTCSPASSRRRVISLSSARTWSRMYTTCQCIGWGEQVGAVHWVRVGVRKQGCVGFGWWELAGARASACGPAAGGQRGAGGELSAGGRAAAAHNASQVVLSLNKARWDVFIVYSAGAAHKRRRARSRRLCLHAGASAWASSWVLRWRAGSARSSALSSPGTLTHTPVRRYPACPARWSAQSSRGVTG